jgi:hypothetical protein
MALRNRSGDSPVPRPSTPTIVHSIRLGDEWYVVATRPSGQHEHIRRFKTESEANHWIARKSEAWLKKRS